MNRHSVALAGLVVMLTLCSLGWTSPVPAPPSTQDLLRAPVIVSGEVVRSQLRPMPQGAPHATSAPTSLTALLRVNLTLKGDLPAESQTIQWQREAWADDGWRPLKTGRNYVLFLRATGDPAQIRPFNNNEFALETETVPASDVKGLAPEEAMRAIAEANVVATSDTIAARWCDFLGGMYRDQDRELFAELASSEHRQLRGAAIAALCEHTEATTSTYALATAFIKGLAADRPTTSYQGPGPLRNSGVVISRICAALRKDALKTPPSDAMLREWLQSDVSELESLALDVARNTHRAGVLPEALAFMQRTPNRDLQYLSFVTVSVLDGTKGGPDIRGFALDPDRYVKEALARHSTDQSSK